MMFVDASALCAMLTNENDAAQLLTRLQPHTRRITSPLAVWETVVAVSRILDLPMADVRQVVEDYLALTGIVVFAVPAQAAWVAIQAFDRFGIGRHPAKLSFGDCFAYACARCFDTPLLSKGNDFSLTDIDPA